MSPWLIVGDGGWGTTLALLLHRNGLRVRVWGPFEEQVRACRETRENKTFLPGIELPAEIEWTSDPDEAARGAEAAVLAVPSRYLAETIDRFAPRLARARSVLSVVKGLEEGTLNRMSEVAAARLPGATLAVLSGPTLAPEVARGTPAAATLASRDEAQAWRWQQAFSQPTFRTYTSDDVMGVELGGALKNVIAIAAGICDGLRLGDNAKAALITRGLAEMTRIGAAMGAHPATFSGLSGLGDLVATCASPISRNRTVGQRLGEGERLDDILGGMRQVAEGVWTARAACALADRHGVDAPIAKATAAVLFDRLPPRDALRALMTREPKPERDART